MLATAKAEKLGLKEKVKFSHMDAENLEFEAETFDAVVSLFALLHFRIRSRHAKKFIA